MNKAIQPSICTATGSTGDTSHHAIASISTPKQRLTASIHTPARGSNAPADTPTSSSGTLMPTAIANSALPPMMTSRVWLMYSSAPASGAATHGPTISPEIAPMANTPASLPDDWRFETVLNLSCSTLGTCSS